MDKIPLGSYTVVVAERVPMAPVQKEILKALDGRELSMRELVGQVRQNSDVSATSVKAAVLPLILRDCVEMTWDRKLRLQTK
jgi:hypothetical protein